ncbi:MAG TPA: sialidase family protein [Frankiaceae bacterium]|nr:sialidase family protein [Frankiaceae bacterium]
MRRSLVALACSVAAVAVVGPADAGRTVSPSYRVYVAPPGLGNSAGEPTLGVIPGSDTVMFQSYTQTLNVSGFDRKRPGDALWRDTAPFITKQRSFDPILEMDPVTGRTFVSQLTLACSLMAYTDDRGESWTDVPLGCGAGSMFDHQSVAVGPYVKGGTLERLKQGYPNVVYYCAQDVASAKCAPSIDGGDTFLPANVVYTTAECQLGGIFGHVKAAPDGTVYLPPRYCPDIVAGKFPAGVAVSEDNGLSWDMRTVPGSSYGDAGHGSVAIAKDGTVYLSWGGGSFPKGGPVNVAVSRDKGKTWTKPVALGRREFGISNTRFPIAVAGDGDRAVIAWLGSAEEGDGSVAGFNGTWHLYASHTYDRGKTWKSYRVASHPIQVGAVCTAGTTCGDDRNLLDFNDMVIDSRGRVYIAFADGCLDRVCDKKDRLDKASIARLVAGRGLYAKYDKTLYARR